VARTTLGGAAKATASTIQPIEAASIPAPTPPTPEPAGERPTPARRPRRVKTAAKWEESNRRTNVWMPVGLPEQIRAELGRRNDPRTMSALVVDLLNGWVANK